MLLRKWITVVLLFSASLMYSQSYQIDLKVKGVSDTVVYLGMYFQDKKFAIDTFDINHKGEVVMKGDSLLHQGVYLVLFPSLDMKYFEVLMGEDQHFSLKTDTSNFTQNMKVSGNEENKAFFAFHNYMNQQAKRNMPLKHQLDTLPSGSPEAKEIRDKLIEREKDIKAYWKKLSIDWKGSLFGTIMKAMIEPELPPVVVPEHIANKDSAKRMMNYLNYKEHYFDNLDLSDNRLIRTPFFYNKIDKYVKTVVVQHPDSVLKEGVNLIEASRGADEVFQFLVQYMFSYRDKTKLMAMDRLFVGIAEKYYLSGEADWVDSTFLAKVKERVINEKPNLIGKKAAPLKRLETYDKQYVSLSDIHNKYTVIIFWEPNCGHCKIEVPKLYKAYQQLKKDNIDVEVLAVYIQFEREPWEKFIEKKEIFDWVNAYDKYNFTNFRYYYDIHSTPIIYLLDKDKKIVAKHLGVDQVAKILYDIEKKTMPKDLFSKKKK